MNAWAKVVTQPLGLAGFALFVVFSVVAQKSRTTKAGWMTTGAFLMACIALVGGLLLAYLTAQNKNPPVDNQQQFGKVQLKSSGNGAVNAAGVQGGSIMTNNGATGQDSTKTSKVTK